MQVTLEKTHILETRIYCSSSDVHFTDGYEQQGYICWE